MVTIRTVKDAYQMALKAEEKLSRKQGQQGRQSSIGIIVRTQEVEQVWKHLVYGPLAE